MSAVAVEITLLFNALGMAGDAGDPPKRPVPDSAAQARSLATVRHAFKGDFNRAKTLDQKRALVQKMIGVAAETTGPADRYVVLRVARDVAVGAGDARTAIRTIEAINESYQIDVLKMKAAAVRKAEEVTAPAAMKREIAAAALELADEAVAKIDFPSAKALLPLALAAARKSGDMDLVKQVAAREKEVQQLQQQFEAAMAAVAVLKKDPTNPDANLAVGQYLCIVRKDWRRALPRLAAGSDAAWKAAAVADLADPTEAKDQAAIGDAWWDLAQKEQGIVRTQLLGRAGKWYRRALPDLPSGLTRLGIEKRLRTIPATTEPADDPLVKTDPPPPKTGDRPVKQPPHTGTARRGGPLVVQYKCGDANASDNQIKPQLQIVNTSRGSIPLNEIAIRYWYTTDPRKEQRCWCDYAKIGAGKIKTEFHPVRNAAANCYLEVTFTDAAGALAPGDNTGEMQLRISRTDWSNYVEKNDYSFDPTRRTFDSAPRITAYRKGELIWGTEPGGKR